MLNVHYLNINYFDDYDLADLFYELGLFYGFLGLRCYLIDVWKEKGVFVMVMFLILFVFYDVLGCSFSGSMLLK